MPLLGKINVASFLASFKIMGLGMLGIFIVIIVIIFSIWLLNKLTSPKKDAGDTKSE